MDAQVPISTAVSDEQFVLRTRGGDRTAFDNLIERYQQRCVSIAYRMLGNLHDALEVCQEAFIRAFSNLEHLESPERFRPWLLRIVTNLSLNFRRARSVGGMKVSLEDCILNPDSPQEHLLHRNGQADEFPGSRLAASELSDAIREGLTELTEQQRTALVLFSIEQLPQKEVAAIMECSVEAVKWHVFQARKRMKERLVSYF